jgi:hypothetical protein
MEIDVKTCLSREDHHNRKGTPPITVAPEWEICLCMGNHIKNNDEAKKSLIPYPPDKNVLFLSFFLQKFLTFANFSLYLYPET